MKFFKNIILIVFTLIIFSLYTSAQIINIEKKRKEKENGFQGTASFELAVEETGDKIISSKNTTDLQYSYNANTFILLGNVELLRVNKGDLKNSGFAHFRYNYTIRDSSFVTLEAFGQYQYNESKLLKTRMVGGGGTRFRFIHTEKFYFYAAPLIMYEYELLSDDLGTETKLFRLDSYLNFSYSLNKYITLNNISYYQPALTDFDDYRISSETGLLFKINKYLSMSIAYSFEYDNEPPENIKNTFYSLKNKLVLKF